MKAALVYIAIFAFVKINGQSEPEASDQATKKGCCFPRKFTATLVDQKSSLTSKMGYLETSLDYDEKKQNVFNYEYNPETGKKILSGRVIFDYSKKKTFFISGEKEEQCRHMPLEQPMASNCLTGMTYVSSSYVGPAGSGFPVDTWTSRSESFKVTMTVSRKGCVPVTQAQYGYFNGFPTDNIFMYENFKPNYIIPGSFHLPDSCKREEDANLVFQPEVEQN